MSVSTRPVPLTRHGLETAVLCRSQGRCRRPAAGQRSAQHPEQRCICLPCRGRQPRCPRTSCCSQVHAGADHDCNKLEPSTGGLAKHSVLIRAMRSTLTAGPGCHLVRTSRCTHGACLQLQAASCPPTPGAHCRCRTGLGLECLLTGSVLAGHSAGGGICVRPDGHKQPSQCSSLRHVRQPGSTGHGCCCGDPRVHASSNSGHTAAQHCRTDPSPEAVPSAPEPPDQVHVRPAEGPSRSHPAARAAASRRRCLSPGQSIPHGSAHSRSACAASGSRRVSTPTVPCWLTCDAQLCSPSNKLEARGCFTIWAMPVPRRCTAQAVDVLSHVTGMLGVQR